MVSIDLVDMYLDKTWKQPVVPEAAVQWQGQSETLCRPKVTRLLVWLKAEALEVYQIYHAGLRAALKLRFHEGQALTGRSGLCICASHIDTHPPPSYTSTCPYLRHVACTGGNRAPQIRSGLIEFIIRSIHQTLNGCTRSQAKGCLIMYMYYKLSIFIMNLKPA